MRRQYQKTFPGAPKGRVPTSAVLWRAAARNGATLGWALRAAEATANTNTSRLGSSRDVGRALRLATAVPIGVIDGLLMYGWTVAGLYDLMTLPATKKPDVGFPEMARRLGALYRAVSETGRSDGKLLPWHAVMAVLAARETDLTDLQALRWLQVLLPNPGVRLLWGEYERVAPRLRGWGLAVGPEGWAWPAAGYTPEQAQTLLALPETHPERPGPDQLAVMAALRET